MCLKRYQNLRKFSSYFLKQKMKIRNLICVMILASALGLTLPYFYSKRLLEITNLNYNKVLLYSLIIISIIFFHHLFWYLWEKLASILTNHVATSIRKDLIESFVNTNYSIIKNKTSGYYLERINDDVLDISSFMANVLGTLVDTITNVGFLIMIYFLNYQCGLVFTVGIIILYIIDYLKIKQDLKYTQILKTLKEMFNSKINENYKAIKEIKGLGIKQKVIIDTVSISESISQAQIKKDQIYALLSRIKTFFQYLIEIILIIYAIGTLIPNKEMTLIILLMIINYSGFMYELVEFFAKMKDYFVKGEYKATRILEILDNKNYEQFGNNNINISQYSITVNNLSYYYNDNKNHKIINNINFTIKEKSISIFIGSSGSGKSTLFGILSKLLFCENNKVLIGDKDINSFSENEFRKQICIINQDPYILNDTIINNIRMVKPEATYKEICNSCKIANIYNDIMSFDKKFDTLILENGSNLSGGQKQRIALSQAILKDSPILLFDEPTSALDKENQKLFLNTIKNLKSNKTILIIAHKVDDYSIFDNIYELNKGNLTKVIK